MGTVGRLEAQKAPERLLDAFSRFVDRHAELDPHLLYFGSGSLRTRLERRIESSGLGDRVHLRGHIEMTAEHYAEMDVFVLPSSWEGLPLSLLEALSCGIPTIATDVGGVRDAIRDGHNGILVPRDDEARLDAALNELVDAGRRRALGEVARLDAIDRFDVRRMVDETVAVYAEAHSIRRRKSGNKKLSRWCD